LEGQQQITSSGSITAELRHPKNIWSASSNMQQETAGLLGFTVQSLSIALRE